MELPASGGASKVRLVRAAGVLHAVAPFPHAKIFMPASPALSGTDLQARVLDPSFRGLAQASSSSRSDSGNPNLIEGLSM